MCVCMYACLQIILNLAFRFIIITIILCDTRFGHF